MSACDQPLKLSRLRDIGWGLWDPIGLLPLGDAWENHAEFADEYDSYLREADSRIRRGASVAAVADELMRAATEEMGLGEGTDPILRAKCKETARAIRAYLDEASA